MKTSPRRSRRQAAFEHFHGVNEAMSSSESLDVDGGASGLWSFAMGIGRYWQFEWGKKQQSMDLLEIWGYSPREWFKGILIRRLHISSTNGNFSGTKINHKSASIVEILAGWWFGTFFIFPHLGNFIIPIDELLFFRGVAKNHKPALGISPFFPWVNHRTRWSRNGPDSR